MGIVMHIELVGDERVLGKPSDMVTQFVDDEDEKSILVVSNDRLLRDISDQCWSLLSNLMGYDAAVRKIGNIFVGDHTLFVKSAGSNKYCGTIYVNDWDQFSGDNKQQVLQTASMLGCNRLLIHGLTSAIFMDLMNVRHPKIEELHNVV